MAYLYSDFRSLYSREDFQSKRDFLQMVVDRLLENFRLLVIPSFTYTKEGTFDPNLSLTNLGALNRFIQTHLGAYTSNHPMFSFSALGEDAELLLRDIGTEAFGSESVFDRLRRKNSVFLHLGRPPKLGNTAMHFVEWQRQVPYRTEIPLSARVVRDGSSVKGEFSAFLRRDEHYRDGTFGSDFSATAEILQTTKRYERIYGTHDFDSVWVGPYSDIVEEMGSVLDSNPHAFVRSVA